MTSVTTANVYCYTCKRAIGHAWWTRHIKSIGHLRRALGDPPPFVQPPSKGQPANDSDDGEPDTRTPCGGCSRCITSGYAYWRDDGNAYHNNCVPLTTTRPLNPPPTAQGAPQHAGKLVAGVWGVQLGMGRPQNG